MTPGGRLAAIARRYLHPTTFRLVVAPAIADLQFEVSGPSRRVRLQAYCGVWRALAGAVWIDCLWRVQSLVADEARMSSLRADMLTFAWLAAFQLAYFLAPFTIVFGRWPTLRGWLERLSASEAIFVGLVVLIPVLPVVVLFWSARRAEEDPCIES